ncbi:MAG: sulfotransferase [Rhodothermales bacterium]
MRLPDFLLIGAAKSGTTALFHYLGQHPGIYACPVREPNFFALEGKTINFTGPGDKETVGRHSINTLAEYGQLFEDTATGQVAGEVSPLYLYDAEAPARIRHYLPQVKLLVMLRNPVDRAYASYLHLRRDGRESSGSFQEGLLHEDKRIGMGWEHLWHYVEMGRYATQLNRYLTQFDRSQIKILLYDDFQEAPAAMLRECFEFLHVDHAFEPDFSRRPNRSGIPRSTFIQKTVAGQGWLKQAIAGAMSEKVRGKLVSQIQKLNLSRPALDQSIRIHLGQRYREELLELQDLIGRDLSTWLAD